MIGYKQLHEKTGVWTNSYEQCHSRLDFASGKPVQMLGNICWCVFWEKSEVNFVHLRYNKQILIYFVYAFKNKGKQK